MATAEHHTRGIAVAAIGPAFFGLVGAGDPFVAVIAYAGSSAVLAVVTIRVACVAIYDAILDTVVVAAFRAVIAVLGLVAGTVAVAGRIAVAQLPHPEVAARQCARQLETVAGPGLDGEMGAVVSNALGDLARRRLPAEHEVDRLDEVGLPRIRRPRHDVQPPLEGHHRVGLAWTGHPQSAQFEAAHRASSGGSCTAWNSRVQRSKWASK